MGATDFVFLPLQDGKLPDDPNSAAGQAHNALLEILLSQPGVQRAYWGREIEDRLMLRWVVDWDDVEDHKKFINSESAALPDHQRFYTC